MKPFLILVIGLLTAVSACTVKNISSDPVKEINFDKDSNIHVISIRNSKDVLTLLDKKHNKLREIDAGVTKNSYLITNKDKNVFFMVIKSAEASSPNSGSCQGTLYNYNSESVTSKVFNNLKCDGGKSILDEDGNLYINTVEGVSLVRKDQTTPILISNLENYTFHHILEDGIQRVFFASNEPGSIYVITKKEKSLAKPSAKKVGNDGTDRTVTKFVYRGSLMSAVIFTKNDNSGMDLELLDSDGIETWMMATGTKPFYGHVDQNPDYVYFVEIDNRNVTRLQKSRKLGIYGLDLGSCTFDKKRELIASDSTADVWLACNEGLLWIFSHVQNDYNPEPKKLSIPNNEVIEDLAIDRSDHVWILAKNLFEVIYNHGLNINKKTDVSFTGLEGASPILKINPDTQEKVIGAQSGLHVCV